MAASSPLPHPGGGSGGAGIAAGMLVVVFLCAFGLTQLAARHRALERAVRRWALTAIAVRDYDPEAASSPTAFRPVPLWRRLFLFVSGRDLTPTAEDAPRSRPGFFGLRRPSSLSPATTGSPAPVASVCSSPGPEDPESCAVCTDDLARDDRVRQLLCGHTFHAPCIGEWLVRGSSPTCPLW